MRKAVAEITSIKFSHEGVFMKLQSVLLTMVTASAYSCGSMQDSKVKSSGKDILPAAAIIAVQDNLDASTNRSIDDFRTLDETYTQTVAVQIQEQDLPKIFEQAQKTETLETQQQELSDAKIVRGWFHYRKCPGRLVRLVDTNQREPVILDSCQAYHQYQPVYILRGRAHRFFFHRAYKMRNVTYYYYVNKQNEQQNEVQDSVQNAPQNQEQNAKQDQSNEQKQKQEEQQTTTEVQHQQQPQIQSQKQIPAQKMPH
jgi:hypothetical protein